jgi:Trk-type K+ transport system membrane component
MTFTSFFGYFFKGGSSSFSEKFLLSDFFSEDNVAEIAKTLMKVIFITLIIEGIGVLLIFFSLDVNYFPSIESRIRVAIFHSIAAFCNSGFSTLPTNVYYIATRNNIPFLYSLCFLIILGGIGFPILLNFYTYLKFKIISVFQFLTQGVKKASIPQLININTRLVLTTTLLLLIVGTVFFFIFEHNNVLAGLSLSEKITQSFFGSVAPRTAGYNSVNYTQLSMATIVLTIFLMWIGASPVSTGGGIKTSTFAIAMLNTFRIARIKRHIEFHKREIHERSVNRASAIIILSVMILGIASLILHLLEPQKGAKQVLFECVSAFGTVGLSLGITPELKDYSKLLLIALMFIGRMGILTILFAIFRKAKPDVYRYPKENIVIN